MISLQLYVKLDRHYGRIKVCNFPNFTGFELRMLKRYNVYGNRMIYMHNNNKNKMCENIDALIDGH